MIGALRIFLFKLEKKRPPGRLAGFEKTIEKICEKIRKINSNENKPKC